MPPKGKNKKAKPATAGYEVSSGQENSIAELTKQLWQAAVRLRGSIEPADYKRYVLPIIFLRFLSLRFERARSQLEALTRDETSDYFCADDVQRTAVLDDPDEYRARGAFIVPADARWDRLVE